MLRPLEPVKHYVRMLEWDRLVKGRNTEMSEFSSWFGKQLERREWNQRDFSGRSGFSSSTISRWITGASIPDATNCDQIADVLGVDRDLVLAIAGHRPPDTPIDPDDPRERVIALIRRARIDQFRADTLEALLREWMRHDSQRNA